MLYRGWDIRAHAWFSGFSAEYTSPTGRAHQTAACFATAAQAIAYAQTVVDYLLGLQDRHHGLLPA